VDAIYARAQMGLSLGFHIIFAVIGIAMPVLMVAAEVLWRRTGDPEYERLAKLWAKGTAVFFAVGAVSGTVLSFELGLLFPEFMRFAGPAIGLPFSLEGFAFFTEAIFLGVYLYGWNRVRPAMHIAAGVLVALSGLASAVFVTLVNAWMNAPLGFRTEHGKIVEVDPITAMSSPFALHEVSHMAVAAYMATGIGAGAIHAFALLRNQASTFHRKALGLCLAMAIPCSLVQPAIGHFAGQQVAEYQPLKLAAMERLMETQARAPLSFGPIEIPGALSFLAANDFNATVKGLSEFPREDWPHPIVRWSWLTMIAIGTALAGWAAWALVRRLRRRAAADSRWFLRATAFAGPLGFIAIEAGWIVTEVGRQPWVVYGVLRTNDTVTPMPNLWIPLVVFTTVYLALAVVVTAVLVRHVKSTLGPNPSRPS
jgi:cytochrome bd ubiquinol oxidase subunit I